MNLPTMFVLRSGGRVGQHREHCQASKGRDPETAADGHMGGRAAIASLFHEGKTTLLT